MSIKLMYITSDPRVARIAEEAGVDRIFVDMEYIGKDLRQGGMDTVQSHHTLADVKSIRGAISKAQLLVRCNPIHEKSDKYGSSKEEIEAIIKNGADIIMLPFFKTADEVKQFVSLVDGRARVMLLIETPQAVENIDSILDVKGVDEVFVGLNDLSLGYKMKFMFELLADGTVEYLCKKFKQRGLPFGFGGLASLDGGMLPGRYVLNEHYRLGSECVILSRSFCNTLKITDYHEIKEIFDIGIEGIRSFENGCRDKDAVYFEENKALVKKCVSEIVG